MQTKNVLLILALAVLALVPLAVMLVGPAYIFSAKMLGLVGSLPLLLGMSLFQRDTQLEQTKALPNGAATVASTGFDTQVGAKGDLLATMELEISSPALTTGELPDTETMIYDVYHDTASDFSGEALLMDNVLTQTGAGGAGAAAASTKVRLPVDVNRYVRVKATNSGAGDASGKTLTERLVF